VLSYDKKAPDGKHYWLCKCTGCDETYSVGHYNLTSGKSKGCKFCKGCYREGRRKEGIMKRGFRT
jgi:hypothetical protein